MGRELPSGRQFELVSGRHRATVVEVGGGLRAYSVDEVDLLDGYREDEHCTGARGLPLVPWPNRIDNGTYTFDGTEYQVPLTEPERSNAIHGFLRWRNWTARAHAADRVELGTLLHPMMGYPFTLDVSVVYTLDQGGLAVHTTATNLGDRPAPYGTGQHPYLTVGTDLVDSATLRLAAATWLPTDERGLPTGEVPVQGSPYDFRAGRQIGPQEVDHTFTDLTRDSDGLAWVHVSGPDGRRVEVWVGAGYPFVEIYTAHTQPAPYYRRGLGVEPMTCAPNAFRSGHGLRRLEPDESVTTSWGLRPG
ncbi:MAG TPA: aldose 1-epimerase family protein [Mycobacteriales bacterium]|nr:aldose 1-epimerase family protein [Mycobacteriales bacterium]